MRGRALVVSPEWLANHAALYDEEIARLLGCSHHSIKRLFNRAGVDRRIVQRKRGGELMNSCGCPCPRGSWAECWALVLADAPVPCEVDV